MKFWITILFVFNGLAVSSQDLQKVLDKYNDHSIPYISPEEIYHSSNTLWLLDAREMEEYRVSHLPNAHYIGHKDFSEKKLEQFLPNKEVPIVVYCSIGVRSEKIGKQLKALGYTNVKNLYGGIFEWVNQELPIETPEGTSTDQVHVYSEQWGVYLLKGEKVY